MKTTASIEEECGAPEKTMPYLFAKPGLRFLQILSGAGIMDWGGINSPGWEAANRLSVTEPDWGPGNTIYGTSNREKANSLAEEMFILASEAIEDDC